MAKEKATSILLGGPDREKTERTIINRKWMYLPVLLLSVLGAFSYRMYIQEDCPQINFHLSSIENSGGAMIKFEDATQGADSWEWDFGDGTAGLKDKSPIHLYKDEGTYEVMLMVNGKCSKFQTITIVKEASYDPAKAQLLDSTIISFQDSSFVQSNSGFVQSTDTTYASRVVFKTVDGTDDRIGTNREIPGTVSKPKNLENRESAVKLESVVKKDIPKVQEQQQEPLKGGVGLTYYPVLSTIDHESGSAEDLPQKNTEKETSLSDLDIKTMVFDVSELRQLPADVMNSFCKGSPGRTIVDANNTTMSMAVFFDRIKGKPIRIKSFIVHRDPNDKNCIVGMKIRYSKVGLF